MTREQADFSARPRVLYVLLNGDRNRILNALLDHFGPDAPRIEVGVLGGPGPLGDDLAARNVRYWPLGVHDPRRIDRTVLGLRRLIHTSRPHIVHAHLQWPSLAAALALATIRPRPVLVLTRHHNRTHHRMRKWMHIAIDRWTARRAEHVIAVSPAVAVTLCKLEGLDPSRVSVISNGFDGALVEQSCEKMAAWRERLGPGPVAVAAGRLDPEKDYPTLLRAVAIARARHPDLRLFVAGTGPEKTKETLRTLATELGISGHVIFLGWVADILALMSVADVFVQASQDEALPQTIVEAMAVGVPIAVTTPGGVADVVGVWHPPVAVGDAVGLSARIAAVLDDASAARAVAQEAQADVLRRFAPAAMARAHADLYIRLASIARGQRPAARWRFATALRYGPGPRRSARRRPAEH